MKQNDDQDIGLESISPNYKTKRGIGICYYDPVEESLIEFNPTTKIPVYPMEEGFRRFYIVKDDTSLNFNIVTIKASTTSSDYIVKTISDNTINIEEIESNNLLIDFFSSHPNGIIPFYFYIKSNTTSYLDANIDIELELT